MISRLLLLVALLLVFAVPRVSAQNTPAVPRPRCVQLDAANTCVLYTASIAELIASPNLFDGKRVRTSGYAHFEFEGNGLYPRQEDYLHSKYAKSLWVDLAPNVPHADCQDRDVQVEGTFSARERGHFSMWGGAIGAITRCVVR
jgi:hypothetical protein